MFDILLPWICSTASMRAWIGPRADIQGLKLRIDALRINNIRIDAYDALSLSFVKSVE